MSCEGKHFYISGHSEFYQHNSCPLSSDPIRTENTTLSAFLLLLSSKPERYAIILFTQGSAKTKLLHSALLLFPSSFSMNHHGQCTLQTQKTCIDNQDKEQKKYYRQKSCSISFTRFYSLSRFCLRMCHSLTPAANKAPCSCLLPPPSRMGEQNWKHKREKSPWFPAQIQNTVS